MSKFFEGFEKKGGPFRGAIIGGLGGAALVGSAGYALSSQKNLGKNPLLNIKIRKNLRKKGLQFGTQEYADARSKILKRRRWVNTGLAAATGGLYGATLGHQSQSTYNPFKSYGGGYSRGRGYSGATGYASGKSHKDLANILGASGKETKKSQVKRAFYAQARQHHPDVGGDEAMMKKVNSAWDEMQKTDWFQKLAFYRGIEKTAFLSGLSKMMGVDSSSIAKARASNAASKAGSAAGGAASQTRARTAVMGVRG